MHLVEAPPGEERLKLKADDLQLDSLYLVLVHLPDGQSLSDYSY